MSNKKFRNSFLAAALGLLLTLAVMGTMGFSWEGGVASHKYQTLTFASANYTSTNAANSTALDVGTYGSIQIQGAFVVSTTSYVTLTPQFSNQPVPCTSVTHWFTATDHGLYTARTDTAATTTSIVVVTTTNAITSTTATTTTTTTAAPTLASTTIQWTSTLYAGSNDITAYEVPVMGRCFRVSIGGAGPYYTPTVYIRALNRN